jgi:hypothetical protein
LQIAAFLTAFGAHHHHRQQQQQQHHEFLPPFAHEILKLASFSATNRYCLQKMQSSISKDAYLLICYKECNARDVCNLVFFVPAPLLFWPVLCCLLCFFFFTLFCLFGFSFVQFIASAVELTPSSSPSLLYLQH